MDAVIGLGAGVGVAPTCEAPGLSRATLYRHVEDEGQVAEPRPRPASPRALSEAETEKILSLSPQTSRAGSPSENPLCFCILRSSGARTRTEDLRIMIPTL